MASFQYFKNGKNIKDTVTLNESDEEILHEIALRLNALWIKECEEGY